MQQTFDEKQKVALRQARLALCNLQQTIPAVDSRWAELNEIIEQIESLLGY